MSSPNRSRAELRITADPRLLRVARVTAASMAAELPFTIQDIEDLRVAVDELSAAVMEGCGPDAMVDLVFEIAGEQIEVSGRVSGAGPPVALHPVAADLLGLVAESHELGTDGDDRTFRFTKRARSGAATP